jgi:cell division protein ZapA
MAEVLLTIAGRSYPVGCRDGEEPHLLALAKKVGEKAEEAKLAVGDANEPRLLLLSALLLADELHEAKNASAPETPTAQQSTQTLEDLANSLERFAARLETS